jgi:chemotaxis protein histidine kinase CheA
VSGSAILGNGRVALILDIPALMRSFEAEAARVA